MKLEPALQLKLRDVVFVLGTSKDIFFDLHLVVDNIIRWNFEISTSIRPDKSFLSKFTTKN